MLTGEKAFISGGGASDVYIVMARTGSQGKHITHTFIVSSLNVIVTCPLLFQGRRVSLALLWRRIRQASPLVRRRRRYPPTV